MFSADLNSINSDLVRLFFPDIRNSCADAGGTRIPEAAGSAKEGNDAHCLRNKKAASPLAALSVQATADFGGSGFYSKGERFCLNLGGLPSPPPAN